MNDAMWPILEKQFFDGVSVIKKYLDLISEFGIFGSFSRGDYKIGSDVDFVVFVRDPVDINRIRLLRSEVTSTDCDIVVMNVSVLSKQSSFFEKNVAKDYRKVGYGENR